MINPLFRRLPKHSIFHVVVFTKFSLLDLNLLSVLDMEFDRSEMFYICASVNEKLNYYPVHFLFYQDRHVIIPIYWYSLFCVKRTANRTCGEIHLANCMGFDLRLSGLAYESPSDHLAFFSDQGSSLI